MAEHDRNAEQSTVKQGNGSPMSRRPLERGARVGRYRIQRPLGEGGMGVIYEALDPELNRWVALKLVRFAAQSGNDRLLREAQAMARVDHPNVVPVHDVGTHDGGVFVAMQLVRGSDLGDWLRKPRSWHEITSVMREAGRGLAAAHAAGLVHRDFKPSNVLLGSDDRVLVTDFGLARTAEGGEEAEDALPPSSMTAPRRDAFAHTITRAGRVLGTPRYMSPEHHRGEETDARTDQFSFCVAYYEALAGRHPFRASSLEEMVERKLAGLVEPPPQGSEAPKGVWHAIERGLAADPNQRHPNMLALLEAIDDAARESPPEAPRSMEVQRVHDAIRERLFGVPAEPVTVGKYRIERRLGAGAMGVVYLAHDPELHRHVALKLVRSIAVSDRTLRARLLREARAMARLSHPNVLTVYEVGEHGDAPFIAMEYVEGETLRAWLQHERTPEEIVETFRAAAKGLAAAHHAGLVHRDFKPDNVLVGNDGRVRVGDFGLVRLPTEIGEPELTTTVELATVTGHTAVGTPLYMAPEVLVGGPADEKSDQFSFCAGLYEALYAVPPFEGDDLQTLATNVRAGALRMPPKDRAINARVHRALVRGLALQPNQRHSGMTALAAELEPLDPPRDRRAWLAAAAAAALLVTAIALTRRDAHKAVSLALSALPQRDCRGAPECIEKGACTLHDGACVALSNNDCAAAVACREDGLCSALDGQCQAAGDIDCRGSKACEDAGRCAAKGGRCFAPPASTSTTAAAERRPPRATKPAPAGCPNCASHGRCVRAATTTASYNAGDCIATSTAQCRRSTVCKTDGRCSVGATTGACRAGSDADCGGSHVCRSFGFCHAKHGRCVK